jgi:hypothetical protein
MVFYSTNGCPDVVSSWSSKHVPIPKYDTLEPRSLHNSELYEGMTELPPSRPKTDQKPVSYMISKGTIVRLLGEIGDFLNSLDTYEYDKILELDDELLLCHSELPPYLQIGSLDNCSDAASFLFNGTVQLELLYHQGLCVLHRKFLAKGRLDRRFERSRSQCVQSALALLSLQELLYKYAKLPDGKLRFTRHWYRFTFTSQTFILAAMILCLDLKHRKVEAAVGNNSLLNTDTDQLEPILSALHGSREIWSQAKGITAEAWKVHRVLSCMLGNSSEKWTSSWPDEVPLDAGELHPNGAVDSMELANDLEFDLNIDWVSATFWVVLTLLTCSNQTVWNEFIEGGSFEDAYGAMPPALGVQETTSTINTSCSHFSQTNGLS